MEKSMPEQQTSAAARPVFDEHVALYLDVYREQVGRSDTWGLEALRNLVLLNAAGIAGTITAYQIQAIPRAVTPAACFLLGIVGAFVAIAVGWLLHHLLSKKYERNAATYKHTKNPLDLFDVSAKKFERLNRISIAVGILSLLLFVSGSALLVDLVRQPPSESGAAGATANAAVVGKPSSCGQVPGAGNNRQTLTADAAAFWGIPCVATTRR